MSDDVGNLAHLMIRRGPCLSGQACAGLCDRLRSAKSERVLGPFVLASHQQEHDRVTTACATGPGDDGIA